MPINPLLSQLITKELNRQQSTLTLIPSENYVSSDVQKAQASCFTNKYAEGYPGRRYYGGTSIADELETLCQEEAKKVFSTDYFVNVQPYSGSPANLAIYFSVASPGDTVMGLKLTAGGHLTHGHTANITGKIFNSVSYDVDPEKHTFDYDELESLAKEQKPKLIISGATAYARKIDFDRISQIAESVEAYHLADISHISGLVATGLHPTPFGSADFVMTTTHKMLRGPRGAIIFSKSEELAKKIDKMIIPGMQGGPHLHTISAITQALFEAQKPNYKRYCKQILANAKAMVSVLEKREFSIVTGGTDNHLWLIDLRNKNITGQEAQEKLEESGIVANKNTIPHDPAGPFKPSGIRMGTPAITTRGVNEDTCLELATAIANIIEGKPFDKTFITSLTERFPIPSK